MDKAFIMKEADRAFARVVEVRRYLHQNPELGGSEYGTQKYIMSFLDEHGIENEIIADTGVIALVWGKSPGKTVAIRADIDALPLFEENEHCYRSQNAGVTHACGHDAHTAIALGCAKILNDNKDKFTGCVKFFFQPAEESTGGAERMIAQGCLENPRVDAVIGLHVYPGLEAGKISLNYGAMNAACDNAYITIKGQGGHGAYPHKTIDAVVIAAQCISAAQGIISRNVPPLERAVFTIGRIEGGTAANVVASEVRLESTIRSGSPETRELLHKRISELFPAVARGLGGDAEVVIANGYPALINHDWVVDLIKGVGEKALGAENVVVSNQTSMGGEDFSFFVNECPGAFYNLGCKPRDREPYLLHTGRFDIEEDCMKTGMLIQILSAMELLQREV